MKDLYKRLESDSSATPEEIRQAMEAIADPGIRERVEKILLRPDRRRVYDRNHGVLTQITELRYRLSLYDKECWASGDYEDFTSVAAPAEVVKIGRGRVKRMVWRFLWMVILLLTAAILFEDVSWGRIKQWGADGLQSIQTGIRRLSPQWGMPRHRHVFDSKPFEGPGVPITIKPPFIPDYYVVQLKDWDTDELVLKVFINSVGTYRGELPSGSYRIQYAAGDQWMGANRLFGEPTLYRELPQRLDLDHAQSSDTRVEIELERPRAERGQGEAGLSSRDFR